MSNKIAFTFWELNLLDQYIDYRSQSREETIANFRKYYQYNDLSDAGMFGNKFASIQIGKRDKLADSIFTKLNKVSDADWMDIIAIDLDELDHDNLYATTTCEDPEYNDDTNVAENVDGEDYDPYAQWRI